MICMIFAFPSNALSFKLTVSPFTFLNEKSKIEMRRSFLNKLNDWSIVPAKRNGSDELLLVPLKDVAAIIKAKRGDKNEVLILLSNFPVLHKDVDFFKEEILPSHLFAKNFDTVKEFYQKLTGDYQNIKDLLKMLHHFIESGGQPKIQAGITIQNYSVLLREFVHNLKMLELNQLDVELLKKLPLFKTMSGEITWIYDKN